MTSNGMAVVGLYAALNTAILFWLTIATSGLRRRYKVLIGDGGVPHLTRIMRGHANAVETMPMMIILLMIAALLGTPPLVLHLLGATFTIGRAIHAWHFVLETSRPWRRFAGFGLSALSMMLAAVGLFGHAVWMLIGPT